jgi:hypothetical protein
VLARGWFDDDDALSLIVDIFTQGLKQLIFDAPEIFPIRFSYAVQSL